MTEPQATPNLLITEHAELIGEPAPDGAPAGAAPAVAGAEATTLHSQSVTAISTVPEIDVRDICRESELTPGEVHAAYLELNGQITVHLDSIVGKMVDATKEFKTDLLPLLNMMQSMLSKRGKLRKLLDISRVQTWEDWFAEFEKRLQLKISLRQVQRWLKD